MGLGQNKAAYESVGCILAVSLSKMSNHENLIPVAHMTDPVSRDISPPNPDNREDCIRKDLTRRLKPACEHLSTADFETLISKMTREQLRGEGLMGRRYRQS